jgi:hypothetical protein
MTSLSFPANPLKDFFSFDLQTLSWSQLNANLVTGEPPVGRSFPGFTTIPSHNKLFLFGGKSVLAGR